MKKINSLLIFSGLVLTISGCSSMGGDGGGSYYQPTYVDYSARMPETIASNDKTIVVDPKVHAWAAYSGGQKVHGGLATSGGDYCPDTGRPCRTRTGSFSIYKLGDASCKSHKYPIGKGGALMPYCMFFSDGFSLHGSDDMADANVSHGCVRMNIADAAWVRYNFADIGTRVVVKPY